MALVPPLAVAALLLLLCNSQPAVRAMTISSVTPNQFGSLGGVRLKVEGTGFPTYPAPPANIYIGGNGESTSIYSTVQYRISKLVYIVGTV